MIYADAIGSAAILSRSLIQKTVAQSSMEAELIALHEAVNHLIWCSNILAELGYPQRGITIFEDNQAAIKMTKEAPVNFKGKSKFINRRYFGIHSFVESGEIKLEYICTDENIADYMTKALTGNKFNKFRISIMGRSDEELLLTNKN